MRQFIKRKIKLFLVHIVIRLWPDLENTLEMLLQDSKDWGEDWARDYNTFDYVKDAKKILTDIKKVKSRKV